MRTEAEKKEFAERCLEIEKTGGDVLGYIEINWPSYTPRATWYNLQKQYLRRENHLSEGKINGKEGEKMRRNMQTVYEGTLEIIRIGLDPMEYLKNEGYKNPAMAWHDLKEWARKHGYDDEELPKDLKAYRAGLPKKRPITEPSTARTVEHPTEHVKIPETVIFHGVEFTPMPVEKTHPVTTCCAPSTAKGVSVPDKLPEEPKLDIVSVRSNVKGRWEKAESNGYVHLSWKNGVLSEESSLSLSVSQWQQLAAEIPIALKQLGLL